MTTDEDGRRQDDALEAELRAVVGQLEPLPASVVEAARAAFTLRDLDAELAELVTDSRDEGLAGVRGASGMRLLTWSWGDLTVDVELRTASGRLSVVGQLAGAPVQSLVVQAEDRSAEVEVDELDRFEAVLAARRLRLHLRLGDRTVVTPWVLA